MPSHNDQVLPNINRSQTWLTNLVVTSVLLLVLAVVPLRPFIMDAAFKIRPRCLTRPSASAPRFTPIPHAHAQVQHARQPFSQTCPEDYCPLTDTAPVTRPARSRVVAQSSAVDAAATETIASSGKEQWWKREPHLWQSVHSDEEFQDAISTGDRLVVVDFFATWCHACQNSYPELCSVARDPKARTQIKFVKVCIDELKMLAKREGVSALPVVQVYKPGHGKLVSIDVPPSKVKHLKQSLQTILENPDKHFKVDPNGYVVLTEKVSADQAKSEAERRKREVEALSSNKGSLFDHLRGFLQTEPTTATPKVITSRPQSMPAAQADHRLSLEKQMFLRQHATEYGYDGRIDELYPSEVGCRMGANEHYMDYTGAAVYCQSQLDAVFQELRTNMFGNPHSGNPSSTRTSEKVEEVRAMILKFFNADPEEYGVVFTRSATGALQKVGEAFPWGPGSTFRYLRENHNSVLGIREYALQHGGTFQAVDERAVEEWLASSPPAADGLAGAAASPSYNLFAFPPEDNFAGVKYPLRWVEQVQAKSTDAQRWMVMMDAAAFVPTQPLDLSKVHPDFVSLSFYKMFGYPTGVGALIARMDAIESLKTVFWGGGTVALVTASDDFHVLKCRPTDKLEDGTVPFLDIISLRHGFELFAKLGGVPRIQAHVASLTEFLYNRLISLRHSNGRPVVTIFGKHHMPNRREVQGGIVNFEVLQPDGSVFSYKTFEHEAAEAGFHVRTGAECNPGACYNYLGVAEKEVEALAGVKEGCEDDVEFITVQRPNTSARLINASSPFQPIMRTAVQLGQSAAVDMKWVQVPLGSVRVSLGYMSTFEDVYAFVDFVRQKYVDRKD